ncbi:MAG: hypothetical protein HY481_01485 [Candidatus Vogelbacteria bacterium]|nr:hypothetical protein [Candidatus Vogelbacteria bacterium]
MLRNLSYLLLVALAALYAPWPLTLAVLAASAVFFTSSLPPLTLALFLNFSYGAAGAWPLTLAAAAGAVALGRLARRLIRLR